jgi:hypothetical protein
MSDQVSRGVPVQDLPENQDPSVRHTVNEVTGEVTYWDDVVETGELKEPAKPKRGRKPKAVEPAEDEESGDPGTEVPAEVAATSVRELGS